MLVAITDDRHCPSQEEVDAIQKAVGVLNDSEYVSAYEENANHHREYDFRAQMARDAHVADVDTWEPDKHEPDAYENGTCKICDCEVTRRKEQG